MDDYHSCTPYLYKTSHVFVFVADLHRGREGSYASIKLGAYAPVRDALGASGKDANFLLKFAAGAITGGVGSIVGNPFDVLKTLAQANKGKSVALTTLVGNMYAEQGIAGFYRGLTANIMRACVLNATKMGVYGELVPALALVFILIKPDNSLISSSFHIPYQISARATSRLRPDGPARMFARPFVRPPWRVSS